MSYLKSLSLHNFRSYTEASLTGLASGFIVLTGANGAGKTNILEAVSLFSPGKGLRGADLADLQNRQNSGLWAVAARAETTYGEIALGTGRDAAKPRRTVRIKGETAKSQNELADYISALWLTPAMDRIFLEGTSGRRKFLDRMIFAFDPAHAGRLTRYENALSQRSKLLKEGQESDTWLTALETQMAETGVAIAAARLDFVNRLQKTCNQADLSEFPVADLRITGFFEDRLPHMPALQAEQELLRRLAQDRALDAISGGASVGAHRSDLQVFYRAKNIPADQCSTGEQKSLLIGIILAHAHLMRAERGSPPILLLDEVAAHLDENRRALLFEKLRHLGGQVFVTGTDDSLFSSISEGCFYRVENSRINLRNA